MRGRAQGMSADNHNPATESATTLGTFSFVFIYSSDPENPKTLAGRMRSDGAYVS